MIREPWLLLFLLVVAATAGCNSDSRKLLERAEASWRQGNYELALRMNDLVYKRDPRSTSAAQALLNTGNINYMNLRKINDAVRAYKQLAGEFPGTTVELKAREQLAAIYENEIHDPSQAILEYDKLLESDEVENRAEIEYRRANCYFNMEDYERAWRELRRIEEFGNAAPHLRDQVALKLGNIDQIRHHYPDAVEYFQKAMNSACPECRRSAIINLSETYEALYDFDSAVEALRKLGSDPEDLRRIAQESARLERKKRRLNSPITLPPTSNPPATKKQNITTETQSTQRKNR